MEQSSSIIVKKARLSYAHIWEPQSMNEGQEKKYSVVLLIPKTDKAMVEEIKKAIAKAREDGKTTLVDKKGQPLKEAALSLPLKDGDVEKEDQEEYKGMYFLSAKNTTAPGIVGLTKDQDGKRKPITDKTEVYSGCFAHVSVNFFAGGVKAGNPGIFCSLKNIMKVSDGEPLGAGRTSADSDFADITDEDEVTSGNGGDDDDI